MNLWGIETRSWPRALPDLRKPVFAICSLASQVFLSPSIIHSFCRFVFSLKKISYSKVQWLTGTPVPLLKLGIKININHAVATETWPELYKWERGQTPPYVHNCVLRKKSIVHSMQLRLQDLCRKPVFFSKRWQPFLNKRVFLTEKLTEA